MRTNELRKLIRRELISLKSDFPEIKDVFYKVADEKCLYPHIVFTLSSIQTNPDDLTGKNSILDVDVWDRNRSAAYAEDLSDAIEDLLNKAVLPQDEILPVFYCESKAPVADEDKQMQHYVIRFTVRYFERCKS